MTAFDKNMEKIRYFEGGPKIHTLLKSGGHAFDLGFHRVGERDQKSVTEINGPPMIFWHLSYRGGPPPRFS